MWKLAEEGNYKSSHLYNLYRKYPGDYDEDMEMPVVKQITSISDPSINERTTSIQSRSGIQSTWNSFKFIKFDDSQGEQANKPMEDKDTMVYMKNILVDVNNNCPLFRHNVDYAWAKFLQVSTMLKESMGIFFSNSDLAFIQQWLSYKKVDQIRALFTELPYD